MVFVSFCSSVLELQLNDAAGCGKTILRSGFPSKSSSQISLTNICSSTIIRHLQQISELQHNFAVVYFYFDFNTTAKQEMTACLSSIVAQLCTQLSTLPSHLSQFYERFNRGNLRPSLHELTVILCEAIQSLNHTFIVIDALDECPKGDERDSLFTVLSDIKSKSLQNLHVLVTSRREPDIESVLSPLLTSQSISLQCSGVDWDIEAHISSVLATDPKLQKWSNEIKQEIGTTLTKGANGMQVTEPISRHD